MQNKLEKHWLTKNIYGVFSYISLKLKITLNTFKVNSRFFVEKSNEEI